MKRVDVLSHKPNVLTESQRQRYWEDGFLVLPDYVDRGWLRRLLDATGALIDRSREVTHSNNIFVLEQGHSADDPRLHRVSNPQDHHGTIWDFLKSPLVTDLVADVVGPDVKFHHGKLNVKSGNSTRTFDWHQDIGGWPHTDFSPVTLGVYINGCKAEQGPLCFMPGSHKGALYSLYDKEGKLALRISDEDASKAIDDDRVVKATGGPGTVVLINCRVLHSSSKNTLKEPRPLLLATYSSADSFAYTANPHVSPHAGDIVRGRPAQYASFETEPVCELPPDFRAGYVQPWVAQHEEANRQKS
ncbi:MAG: phytanoyl-CoA dioxygenase family protein [Hyphomicrobiaceae bacterium]